MFGVEAQGNWADFKGSNISILIPAIRNESRVDAFGLFTGQIGYAANNVLFYVKGGAAVTSDRFRTFVNATNDLTATPVTTPAGVAWSASASNTASLRTGRLRSNTIICSCRTVPMTFTTPAGALSVPIASVRTSISSPSA